MAENGVSIIIPTRDSGDSMIDCLMDAEIAARRSGWDFEIIVADDGETEITQELLARQFPQVKHVPPATPHGFARACNRGAAAATKPFLFFLNDDVRLEPDYFLPMASHLHEPEFFGVCGRMRDVTGRVTDGGKISRFARGMVRALENYDVAHPVPGRHYPTSYLHGAQVIMHRGRFEMLNGFDEALSPAYMEDWDISYRALRRGWSLCYEPRSTCKHMAGGTTQRLFSPDELRVISRRNAYLAHWRNLSSPLLLASSVIWPVLATLAGAMRLNTGYWDALCAAMPEWSARRRLRYMDMIFDRRSDRQAIRYAHAALEWQEVRRF